MRANRAGSLLRAGLAAVLAWGLMVPAGALAAEDSESQTPPQETPLAADGGSSGGQAAEGTFDQEPSDPAGDATDGPADSGPATGPSAPAEGAPAGDAPAPENGNAEAPESAAPGDSAASTPSGEAAPQPSITLALVDGTRQMAARVKAAAQPAASSGAASARAGEATLGGLVVSGGEDGKDFQLVGNTVQVLTSTPLTIRNADPANPTTTNIQVNAGVKATITLAGVSIAGSSASPINMVTNSMDTESGAKATAADQILNKTALHLILADGTENVLNAYNVANSPGLRCGEGSVLVIDDSRLNIDASGNPVVPEDGKVSISGTLQDGTAIKKGDPLTVMEASNPGSLTCYGGTRSSGLGGGAYENAGELTFEGGVIFAYGWAHTSQKDSIERTGAGIGGGINGGGTDMYFNGGRITTHGAYHSAGIGAGYGNQKYVTGGGAYGDAIAHPRYSISATVGGNIYINGGFIQSTGGSHGNAFGAGCVSNNNGKIIKVTGGTLLPTSPSGKDIGGDGGYVLITGGSVRVANANKFSGIGGTAYNTEDIDTWGDIEAMPDGALPNEDKVEMITINLSAEINPDDDPSGGNNVIEDWHLYVAGEERDYGAPYQFDNGKLYLWLPKSDIDKQITVELSYRDKDGKTQKVDPLYREPGNGSILKSYIDFELPDEYLEKLTKPYDGTPFEPYDLASGPITTEEDIPKKLDKPDRVKYTYQPYDERDGDVLGPVIEDGNAMPSNVGIMKFIMISDQFSNPAPEDNIDEDFKDRYWGHRATGWCEITPVPSKVNLVNAQWVVSAKPGEEPHDSSQELRIGAEIASGTFDDGTPTADTCKAPEGRVQLFVDGRAVGDPIDILFEDVTDEDGTVHKANATREDNGKGGSFTRFSYVFTPAQSDYLVPDATTDNKHIVSLQYLPPEEGSAESANYLESVNPADDPEHAPKAPVAIDPIDPNPTVTGGKGPDNDDPDAPEPTVTTGKPSPTDPGADPSKPGDKTYRGTITTTWDLPTDDNPHPGQVAVKVKTPSTGKITVEGDDGELFDADFVRDPDTGEPMRDEDGTYTLVLDPKAVGTGELRFKQDPNGAYTGTTWVYRVVVKPNPKIAPQPRLAKTAENLTHPSGPTQPGDRIRYTVTASNAAVGSAWTQVVITDPLPACLALDEQTLVLDNPKDGHGKLALVPAATAGASDVGKFSLATPAADGKRTLTVPAGTVNGGASATLTFECTVREDLDFAKTDELALANLASAAGKRPNPDDPAGPDVDLDPEPNPKPGEGPTPVTPPATPPGPDRVVPLDPQVETGKTVENVTKADALVTSVGDVLRYTVTLANTGAEKSCLVGAVISDPLPVGMEPVAGSIKLALNDGEPTSVPDGAYDGKTRTIAVTAGDLWGGQRAVLTFEVTVGVDALGADNANVARIFGTVPSKGPDSVPENPKPGKPAPTPTGEPIAPTPPAAPPVIVGADPDEGDIVVEKTAENTSDASGKTSVGDEVRYTIVLRNDHKGTSWMDAVIKDVVPAGLEPASGTIKVTLPGGSESTVPDEAYDVATRTLSVAAGHLYGGQEVVLSFIALVTEDAVGADVGNVAVAVGTLPSTWDPDGTHPQPGRPFTPPEGWPAFEQDRPKVESPKAYPPGVDVKGQALASTQGADKNKGEGKKKVDDSKTIKKTRLAKTGDELARGFAFGGGIALVAAAALLVARRRLRRERDGAPSIR